LRLCVDPAGATRSDTAARGPDSSAPGPARSTSANHHPAATDGHHRWTEPGVILWNQMNSFPICDVLLLYRAGLDFISYEPFLIQ